MKLTSLRFLAFGLSFVSLTVQAGQPLLAEKKMVVPEEEPRTWFPNDPAGLITVGGLFSEHLTGAYLDSITGLWAARERDAFLFLNTRYHYEDNGQFLQNTGLGFRQMIPGQEIILGVNAYYDEIHSEQGNDYRQAGLGAEILTRWVDARFNYYLPEDKQYEVDRFSRASTAGRVRTKRTFNTRETPVEGFNAEVGALLPGVDRYAEVRVFAGYHHYNNPYGKDFEGFQARLEARLLPGVIADVEYWDDTALMGGHWTGGVRVSVPFSIYNLATGRNPFAGTGEMFRPRQREFKERMSEMVIRSHRIQTTTSGPIQVSERRSESTEVAFRTADQRSIVVPRVPLE